MRLGLIALAMVLSGCLPATGPDDEIPVPPPRGISGEKLWMNAGGFRVKLSDGTTCHGVRPSDLAQVADERPGWSGQLTRCPYLIDYHIVRRELFGLESLGMALSFSNILFDTFKNGPNWQLCMIDVPDEMGEPRTHCVSQAIKGS